MRPPIRSCIAGPVPLYGTWVMFVPIALVEHHAAEMRRRASAGRTELHLRLVRLGVGDELLEIVHRQILSRRSARSACRRSGDGREVGRRRCRADACKASGFARACRRCRAPSCSHRASLRRRAWNRSCRRRRRRSRRRSSGRAFRPSAARRCGRSRPRSAGRERDDHRHGPGREIGHAPVRSAPGRSQRGDLFHFHCFLPKGKDACATPPRRVKLGADVRRSIRLRQSLPETDAAGRRGRCRR